MRNWYYQQNVPDSRDSAPLTSFQFSFFVTLSLVHYKFKNSQRNGKQKSNVGRGSNKDWNGEEVINNCFLTT